jgi:hypothetical protein
LEAYFSSSSSIVQHEHVQTVLSLRRKLLSAAPNEIDSIMRESTACIVTEQEHKRLSCELTFEGWERYTRAKISVVDVKETQLQNKLIFHLE